MVFGGKHWCSILLMRIEHFSSSFLIVIRGAGFMCLFGKIRWDSSLLFFLVFSCLSDYYQERVVKEEFYGFMDSRLY